MGLFKKATRTQSKLRLALIGVSGSGKTYSSLAIATNLGERIALIDTERGSASKYAGNFQFDALNLDEVFGDYSPINYVKAIRAAETEGYDVIIVDSLSHAWIGKGGALEMHDKAVDYQRTKNSFTAWREVTPHHNALVDALVQCKAHIIVTMRAKTEYVQEKDEKGYTTVRKVGLAPVQRDGLEYEMDLVADMDEGTMKITKSRCPSLTKAVIKNPNGQVSSALKAWLSDGAPVTEPATQQAAAQQPAQPEPSHRTPATSSNGAKPVPKSKEFKRLMAEGTKTFNGQWDDARHWLIERYTRKATPDNVRTSANDLTDGEIATLVSAMVGKKDYYVAEWAKVVAERAATETTQAEQSNADHDALWQDAPAEVAA